MLQRLLALARMRLELVRPDPTRLRRVPPARLTAPLECGVLSVERDDVEGGEVEEKEDRTLIFIDDISFRFFTKQYTWASKSIYTQC
jgi:predicted lipid carrier protein YhbT